MVRTETVSFHVRMLGGPGRTWTWDCSCGAPGRSLCRPALRLAGWVNHHHALAVVPATMRAWRDIVVGTDLNRREAAASRQGVLRFVFTRHRAPAGLDELVITPEIVSDNGAVLAVGGEKTQAQLAGNFKAESLTDD